MGEVKKVRKAVIAAAGFGTRFLPQTKAMPKEMLPLVDKPIIQFIVEQLSEAGVEDIIIVTGYHKRSIEDHFDVASAELKANLRQSGKNDLLAEVKSISKLANFVYIRQKGMYGTATPLLNAAHIIGDEPFFYLYADDLTVSEPNAYSQMITLYEQYGANIIPCIQLKHDSEYDRYGVVGGEQVNDNLIKMNGIFEKPGAQSAPSNFASVGGYLLTPAVLGYLEKGQQLVRENEEFHMTDHVLQPMLQDGHEFYATTILNGTRYDTGDKLGYLKTLFDFALNDEELGPTLRDHLRDVLK